VKLSIIIPAHNEEGSIEETVRAFHDKLKAEKISHEVMVVNDNSKDDTEGILLKLEKSINELRHVNNQEGYDCVFGSRFMRGGKTVDYPAFKLVMNRLTNNIIRLLFGLKYNDITNAFKLYRRDTIEGLKPFLSHHFNLTVELPLKSIVRGYTYAVIPNHWTNRKEGESKLKLKEMGSRYFYIILYCLIEKWLSMGDYAKKS
jgi:dolichol-phosphate mannosyltransferase